MSLEASRNLTQTDLEIVRDVLAHIKKRGGSASQWYVGIAADPASTLFTRHNVAKDGGHWIYRKASTERAARDTETYLLKNFNFKGGDGGGKAPKSVYAYKITNNTVE